MKKMPTIFKRNPENMREILREPHPGCQWVFDGEGVATRKYDGTCCMIDEDGTFWKRREVKKGKKAPDDFFECDYDERTGKRMGWVPVDIALPENAYHREAFMRSPAHPDGDGFSCYGVPLTGTYELIGPKINGNPEKAGKHCLLAHREAQIMKCPDRSFDGLKEWLRGKDIEGLVFHHEDGRMAKIKLRDFGLKRGARDD